VKVLAQVRKLESVNLRILLEGLMHGKAVHREGFGNAEVIDFAEWDEVIL
jgi:hypothetical protein